MQTIQIHITLVPLNCFVIHSYKICLQIHLKPAKTTFIVNVSWQPKCELQKGKATPDNRVIQYTDVTGIVWKDL